MDQAKMKATQLKEQKELLERKKGDLEMQLNEVIILNANAFFLIF